MAEGTAGTTYVQKIPKHIYEKQAYFQGIAETHTFLKGRRDKFSSVLIPAALLATASAMMARGLWNLAHGTGKKE